MSFAIFISFEKLWYEFSNGLQNIYSICILFDQLCMDLQLVQK